MTEAYTQLTYVLSILCFLTLPEFPEASCPSSCRCRPALYIETDALGGGCVAVNGTYMLTSQDNGAIRSNYGVICVGSITSTVTWRAPPNNTAVGTDKDHPTCGVFVDSSSTYMYLKKLYTSSTICSNAVFTCVVVEQDGSSLELYVGVGVQTQPATAALSLTWSTAPPSFVLTCTSSALGVEWTRNGAPVSGSQYSNHSTLVNGMGSISINYTLIVKAALFGNYSCTVNGQFGNTTATLFTSDTDVAPEAPRDVWASELESTFVVIQWSQPSLGPPVYYHNVTYVGGCSVLVSSLVTMGNSNDVTVVGLEEGAVYNVSVCSLGLFNISSPQASIEVQTKATAPTSWPLQLSAFFVNTTIISLSWLDLNCVDWKGLNRSYVVLYWSGGGANMTITVTVPNVTIGNLVPNTRYWIKVAAVSENGTGPFSPAVNITTKAVTLVPVVDNQLLNIIVGVVGGASALAVCIIIFVVAIVCSLNIHSKQMLENVLYETPHPVIHLEEVSHVPHQGYEAPLCTEPPQGYEAPLCTGPPQGYEAPLCTGPPQGYEAPLCTGPPQGYEAPLCTGPPQGYEAPLCTGPLQGYEAPLCTGPPQGYEAPLLQGYGRSTTFGST